MVNNGVVDDVVVSLRLLVVDMRSLVVLESLALFSPDWDKLASFRLELVLGLLELVKEEEVSSKNETKEEGNWAVLSLLWMRVRLRMLAFNSWVLESEFWHQQGLWFLLYFIDFVTSENTGWKISSILDGVAGALDCS